MLAGTAVVPIPEDARIRHVGFITEEEKVAAFRKRNTPGTGWKRSWTANSFRN